MAIKKSDLYSSVWASCDQPKVLYQRFAWGEPLAKQGMMQELLTGRIRLV